MRKGYKKSLMEDDVFELNPRDKSESVVPEFQACWNAEVKRVDAINRAKK